MQPVKPGKMGNPWSNKSECLDRLNGALRQVSCITVATHFARDSNCFYGWIQETVEVKHLIMCAFCIMGNFWIMVDLWGQDKQTDTHTDTHTHTNINTMTRTGLGARPSEGEKKIWEYKSVREQNVITQKFENCNIDDCQFSKNWPLGGGGGGGKKKKRVF